MTHGSYTSYTRGACHCVDCRQANTQHQRDYQNNKRRARGQIGTARLTIPEVDDNSRGSTGNLPGKSIFATAIRVWCRCGNTGYANPWVVGKNRRIDSCEGCR